MSEIIYPIAFENKTCTKCGAENSIRFKDKFDNVSKDSIYPVHLLHCINCKTDFFIRWVDDTEKDGCMNPVICSDNMKSKFEKDIIKQSEDNRRKI